MKKLIIISLLIGASVYAVRKFNINTAALSQLKTKIKNVSDLKIENGHINLKLDLNITNLSAHNLNIDTFNAVSIRQLKFYNATNRMLIGTADVNISNLELASKETIILADIICKIPTSNLLNHLSLLNVNLSDTLRVVPIFNVAGKEVEINPENFV